MDDLFSVFEEKQISASTKSKFEQNKGNRIKDTKSTSDIKNSCENEEDSDVVAQFLEGKRDLSDVEDAENENKRLKSETADDLNLDDYLPRIQIHTVKTIEACLHEVAVPHNADYSPLRPSNDSEPAKVYQFILDPFQKEAILCLENNQSVLVSAHTSAGKTVVAEYAVAMSLRSKQRVIYTTPIKALSNQKYREFHDEFTDVGLMTGDVTINPSASCLIMTTEILRSMLYRGSEVMREVGWVIFDEIHYMRDKERGVVWEETIILLPDSVHFVFLSATIPNARQFAEWICHLHKQPCHVVYTDFRPVPLHHYIFPAGGNGIHLVVDHQGVFKEENFNNAMAVLQNSGDAAKGDSALVGRKGGFKGESNCYKIIKMTMERNFAPVIVFSFSRKECEAYALQVSKLDFNSKDEKSCVQEIFDNAIDILSDEDKKLPQVQNIIPLLLRGIGIHHSGLLPILKETVEILFSEGLIKVLFATETFAMGLNMPAKTVLFTNIRKFDGRDFRWLTSGEYIQMSGRAGRRGLDSEGIVILMVDEKMSPAVGKEIVKGLPDPINSAFHLTYNMVLNLLRVEEINPEYMLERSFFQFQNYSSIPQIISKLRDSEKQYKGMQIDNESAVEAYYNIRQKLTQLSDEFQAFITKPKYLVPFLQPGRIVRVKTEDDDFGWGIVINYHKKNSNPASKEATVYVVDVLLHVSKDSSKQNNISTLKPAKEKGEMQVVPILMHLIAQVSSVRLYYPQDLRPLDNRMSVLKSLQEVQRRFPKGVPLLDPVEEMGIKDPAFKDLVQRIEHYEDCLNKCDLVKGKDVDALYKAYELKCQAAVNVKNSKTDLRRAKSLLQMDELKCRKRVLRRLGYCSAADVIETKGRVACEINSGDELLLTEMIFNGVFNDLTPSEAAALLSCFVFQEKSNESAKLTDKLSGVLRQMQDMARRIAKVSAEAKLATMDEDSYVSSFKTNLMDVIHSWCEGTSFASIVKMTDVFEGSIIRCMRRLEELIRQMVQASKSIGNTELENKFSEAIKLMKRDIAFAASLYL